MFNRPPQTSSRETAGSRQSPPPNSPLVIGDPACVDGIHVPPWRVRDLLVLGAVLMLFGLSGYLQQQDMNAAAEQGVTIRP